MNAPEDSTRTGPTPPTSVELRGLVFDDEPLDAILYGAPGVGPSPASVFEATRPAIDEIRAALAEKRTADALRAAGALVKADTPLPLGTLISLLPALHRLFGNVTRPIVPDLGIDYADILEPVLELARRTRNETLLDVAGTVLYRWFETTRAYAEARAVIQELLCSVTERRNHFAEALLTNNYGYEYLLEGDWDAAEPHFEQAVRLFEVLGEGFQSANTRSNLLRCRFERLGPQSAEMLRPELEAVLAILAEDNDWRQRKPLMMLARLAEQQGRFGEAIKLAQRAVIAGRRARSYHCREDRAFLKALRLRRAQQAPV